MESTGTIFAAGPDEASAGRRYQQNGLTRGPRYGHLGTAGGRLTPRAQPPVYAPTLARRPCLRRDAHHPRTIASGFHAGWARYRPLSRLKRLGRESPDASKDKGGRTTINGPLGSA